MSPRFRIVAILLLLLLAGFAAMETACACARAHRESEPSRERPTVELRFNGDVRCPADDPDCRSGSLDRLRAVDQAANEAEPQEANASKQ